MKTLKLNLFYECTAKCDHCRFHCTNERSGAEPDFETPYLAARELREHCGLDMAVLLGGEPSLYAGQTQELIAKLSGLGLQTRLETNASWAESYESALSFLRPLKKHETQIMLSLDGFHEPYVPFESVVHGVKACYALDLPFVLEIPYLDAVSKAHPLDKRTHAMECEITRIFPDIPLYKGDVLFIGRAADLFGDEFASGKGIPYGPCKKVPWWSGGEIETTELLIYEPGGWITKGCGIAIGNIHEKNIVTMVNGYRAEDNPIFAKLLQGGPYALAQEAEQYGYRIKTDYADPCHMCYEARSALRKQYTSILQPDHHYIV